MIIMIIEMMTRLVIIMNGDGGSKNDDDDGVFSFHNQIRWAGWQTLCAAGCLAVANFEQLLNTPMRSRIIFIFFLSTIYLRR